MTQLTKDTPLPVVWLWMFIAGLGVGPTFSVLDDRRPERGAVQAARRRDVEPDVLPPDRRHGRARLRGHDLRDVASRSKLGPQMSAAGVPPQVVAGFGQATSSGSLDFNNLTGVGDLGAAILAAVPAAVQAAIQPFIDPDRGGIHGAFSLAIAQTFWLGVGRRRSRPSLAAFAIKEIPLRTSNEAPVPRRRSRGAGRRRRKPEPVSADTAARRLTFAPPLTRRPRWTPPGPSFIPDR